MTDLTFQTDFFTIMSRFIISLLKVPTPSLSKFDEHKLITA